MYSIVLNTPLHLAEADSNPEMDKKKSLGKENSTSLKSPVVSKSSKKKRLLVGSGHSSAMDSACTATPRQLSSTPLSSTRALMGLNSSHALEDSGFAEWYHTPESTHLQNKKRKVLENNNNNNNSENKCLEYRSPVKSSLSSNSSLPFNDYEENLSEKGELQLTQANNDDDLELLHMKPLHSQWFSADVDEDDWDSNESPAPTGGNSNIHDRLAKMEFLPDHFKRHFIEQEEIEDGGYGVVYKARSKMDGQIYAIKQSTLTCSDDTTVAVREVLALDKFRHPNIIQATFYWREENYKKQTVIFIQMELCESSLAHWLALDLEHRKKLQIVLEIASAVAYMHQNDYMHRDLKPENIMISQAVKIQLIDFGLVKNLSEENLTPDVGTVEYMAPEQKGNVYTHKVDIFAMGLIVFEIFYPMTTVAEKVHVFSDLKGGVFPNGFKGEFPDIARLIGRMLSENPSHRPEAEIIVQAFKKLQWSDTNGDFVN
ncbi:interferon-induced, double-stranded RNA-activated protein kinase-like isoform X1 [Acipenser oxyrinchus oxyrinchus]|uniref:non-specific serine/threonine protein kinase n=1 Tax=Acipenser oxyrinchus oxyrinchus TaxID=40147 RepID=A0AAD8GDB6_ACIOX|nr:interferon-induced, double-stranded RNA-activated protein kinase-like isoform X1 [Acipenser oxyrinchus oxyrinchus]